MQVAASWEGSTERVAPQPVHLAGSRGMEGTSFITAVLFNGNMQFRLQEKRPRSDDRVLFFRIPPYSALAPQQGQNLAVSLSFTPHSRQKRAGAGSGILVPHSGQNLTTPGTLAEQEGQVLPASAAGASGGSTPGAVAA